MPVRQVELTEATAVFFDRHWNVPEPRPHWCETAWDGIGSVPFHDQPGCYALLRDGLVVYIGSAVGVGSKRYRSFGISFRLNSYIRRDRGRRRGDGKPVYRFRRNHTGAYTIGFPPQYAYLALALEHFLIGCFADQLENRRKTSHERKSPASHTNRLTNR
jgi:hypothetical protein